jgi:glutathione S-transferase
LSKKVKFYMFPGSNSVMTARLMLDHKGVEYDTVMLPPGAHSFIMLGLGFETMAVPALKIDGRRIQGTRWIARALDEEFPQRPLFPADPVARKAVEDAERWGEGFQNSARRIFYCAARRDRKAFASVMTAERGPLMRAGLRMAAPLIVRLATGAHRASDDHAREDLMMLPERLDQIDAWIAQGVLNGADLNAADFQIAPNLSALLFADDLAPYVQGRPAAALARRAAPGYHGHVDRVLPQEWLAPLRSVEAARTPAGDENGHRPEAPASTKSAPLLR